MSTQKQTDAGIPGNVNRDSSHDKPLTLSSCEANRPLVVLRLAETQQDSFRLRELGIVEGNSVMLLHRGDPLLVLVEDTRLAVDIALARGIEVSYAAR